ncbi:MAG: putative porin [Sedimentisphaerales bacterium]|nr:putative porin [Sedimentisphaerales bacterium]
MDKGKVKGWSLRLSIVMIGALVWPAIARSDEIDDLRQELAGQKQRTAELEDRINQLEARQRLKERSQKEDMEQALETVQAQPKEGVIPQALEWAKNVKWSGDFRYRYEFIDKQGSPERHRNRIRARLGLEAKVADEWDVAFRLASGERDLVGTDDIGDPISSNQTLTKYFSSKDIWLDLAYFDYHPGRLDGLNVFGGKVKNPFLAVGKNQMIWDSDLNPEGISGQYGFSLNPSTKGQINAGGFWVNESSSGVDTGLFGVQGYLTKTLGNPDTLVFGAGYYNYTNLQGRTDAYGILAGNTAGPGNTWASDYTLIELFAEYTTKVFDLPFSVFGDWVHNVDAITDQDTGWLVGTTINKAKDPGSWQFSYDYRDLEADAVVGAFTDSDFIGGGTGGQGHRFAFAYQVAKNVQAALTYFLDTIDRSGPDLDYSRLQADLVLKF